MSGKQPWVHYDAVLEQAGGSRARYREFVREGIERGYDTPWESVTGQVVLGEAEFIDKVKGALSGAGKREQPSARDFAAKGAAMIVSEVVRRFGVREGDIRRKRSADRDVRAMVMEMLHRHGQLSQAAIGRELGGLDYVTVSRERKRLRERAEVDRQLGKRLREMDECLRLK